MEAVTSKTIAANELRVVVPQWEEYEITENGEVFSLRRNKWMKIWRGRSKEYPRVTLSVRGKEKSFCIHKLVALSFIPNPDGKKTVNHKDGDKHNNHVSNLEWATWSENQIHAITTGLAKVPVLEYGENHPHAKLSNVDVAMIRVLCETGFTNLQISKRFGVHETHVSAIKLNKTRTN